MDRKKMLEAAEFWITRDAQMERMDSGELFAVIEEFIEAHHVCALATASGDLVRCTPMEYNYYKGSFWFFSEGGLKFKALADNLNVCFAIYEPADEHSPLQGMQISGVAEVLDAGSDEYRELLAYKHINLDLLDEEHPINLIKVVPCSIDFLNTKLKGQGHNARQHYDYPA